MFEIDHQVRVFVFQVLQEGVEFLLLRQKPTVEWPFGPVVGTVQPDECMRDTICRQVREETGIERPTHILDLQVPKKELFGDLGLVEWPYAYQAGTPQNPIREVTPGPRIGDFAWLNFDAAFACMENEQDLQALVRLRLCLQ
jgi:8-oxo-dGTP pyrophosphatase MutT (NUDIX family)